MNQSLYFVFYTLHIVLGAVISLENVSTSIEETFEFVSKAQNKLNVKKNANIILVLGNTGCGKSTLVHYAAGDFSKIESLEPIGHQTEYKIQDGLDPDSETEVISTTVSRTLVPEMVIDEDHNIWYDCPGFGDTRNSTIEIATTFLIKSVIESAANMKIVLVVNYDSVTESHDRQDFDRLLSHATQLLKNIKLFQSSISLVVN